MNHSLVSSFNVKSRRLLSAATWLVLPLLLSSCVKKVEGEKRERSYAIGHALGAQLKEVKESLDVEFVSRGLRDSLEGKNELDEARISTRVRELDAVRTQVDTRRSAENLERSKNYIEGISKKPGIRKIADGIFVEEKKASPSKKAPLSNRKKVSISYIARTADGSIFDQVGESTKLVLRDVALVGLRTALNQMPVGAEWVVYLAPDQAFGSSTRPGIPSQSAVSYEIKMLDERAE